MVQRNDALQRGALIASFLLLAAGLAGAAVAADDDTRAQALCDSLQAAEDFTGVAQAAQAWLTTVDARGDSVSVAAAAAVSSLVRAAIGRGGKPVPGEAAMAARLLAVTGTVHGTRSAAYARALVQVGQVGERGGDFAGARERYEASLALRRDLQMPEDGDLATCLVLLANVRARLGDLAGLDASYTQALAIVEATEGPQSLAAARVLVNHAIYAKLTGAYATAEDYYRRALAIQIAAHGERQPDVARTCFNLANLQVETGSLAEARANYRRALAIREDLLGPQSAEVARTLGALALLEKKAANLLLARDYAARAVQIQQRGTLPLPTADALATLAAVQSELGDVAAARAALEQILAIFEKAYGPDHARVGQVLVELGHLHSLQGDHEGGLTLMRRGRAIYETVDPAHGRVAAVLVLEALLLADMRHDQEARAAAARAVGIHEALGAPAQAMLGRSLGVLGRCLWQCGAFADAEATLRRADGILADRWGADHPLRLEVMFDLARVRAAQGAAGEALDLALEVERGRRAAERLTIGGLSERLALQQADRLPDGVDLAATLAAEGVLSAADVNRVWTEALRSRALVLDEMAQRRQTPVPVGGTVVDSLQAALAVATRDLAGLLVESWRGEAPDDLAERTGILRSRCEAAEERLGRLRPRPQGAAAAEAATLAMVAAARRPGEALVAYLRYDRQRRPALPDSTASLREPSYLAFVLPVGGHDPRVVNLGPAAELERLVRTWRDEVALGNRVPGRDAREAAAACRRAGAALRARVWDPIATELGPATRVAVVPDGPLHLINLAALPVGADRYLVDDERLVVVLGTERDLLRLAPSRAAPGELIAFGAPAMPEALGPLAFAPLPASAQEVTDVAAVWRRAHAPSLLDEAVVTRIGEAASEAAFKTLSPGFGTVHLATHGFVLDDDAVAALPGQRGVGGLQAEERAMTTLPDAANPMLRAGLVLSAGDGEDGILTAAEIALLDLDAVEWVVLSACGSGLGQTQAGEGVFGLRRAFRLAGARGLVASLWPLADDQTRDWMLALYDARAGLGDDLGAAVWQASRARLQARRGAGLDTHPQTWGGFIACGD